MRLAARAAGWQQQAMLTAALPERRVEVVFTDVDDELTLHGFRVIE